MLIKLEARIPGMNIEEFYLFKFTARKAAKKLIEIGFDRVDIFYNPKLFNKSIATYFRKANGKVVCL